MMSESYQFICEQCHAQENYPTGWIIVEHAILDDAKLAIDRLLKYLPADFCSLECADEYLKDTILNKTREDARNNE